MVSLDRHIEYLVVKIKRITGDVYKQRVNAILREYFKTLYRKLKEHHKIIKVWPHQQVTKDKSIIPAAPFVAGGSSFRATKFGRRWKAHFSFPLSLVIL